MEVEVAWYIPYLEKAHVRELLQWKNKCYRCHGNDCPGGYGYALWDNGPEVPLDAIKAELAKRPHVMNKQEHKEHVQERMKSKPDRTRQRVAGVRR